MTFGTILVKYIQNAQVPRNVLGLQQSDVVQQRRAGQACLYLLYALDGTAEHGLHWVLGQCIFDGTHKIYVLHIIFKPASNAAV